MSQAGLVIIKDTDKTLYGFIRVFFTVILSAKLKGIPRPYPPESLLIDYILDILNSPPHTFPIDQEIKEKNGNK